MPCVGAPYFTPPKLMHHAGFSNHLCFLKLSTSLCSTAAHHFPSCYLPSFRDACVSPEQNLVGSRPQHAICRGISRSVCATSANPQVIIGGDTQDEVYEHLVDRVLAMANPCGRIVVGVSGVPGSGKTTTAEEVATRINHRLGAHPDASPAISVSMDGYHYYRRELDAMDDPEALHARRGAHWTFNAEAFVEAMRLVKAGGALSLPTFQHGVGDPVEAGMQLLESHTIVIVEGNYVLLDVAPWDQLAELFDDRWYVDTDVDLALDRLLQRQMQDNKRSEDEVRARIASNDRPNAELVHAVSRDHADVIISPMPHPCKT